MHQAFRSLDRATRAGEALPSVWKALDSVDVRFYRGELSLIAGPPGGGKSTVAFGHAAGMKRDCVYVSCDMGQHSTFMKWGQLLTGRSKASIEGASPGWLRDLLAKEIPHVWMEHEVGASLGLLDDIVNTYWEIHSEPPAALYVDNLMNVNAPGDSQATKDKKTCEVLHAMAARYEIAVIGLCHTFIKRGGRPWPGSQDEIKGQISELPGLVLTVAGDDQAGVMKLCPVKNRHGRADPAAQRPLELKWDPPSGVLTDFTRTPQAPAWNNFYEKQED